MECSIFRGSDSREDDRCLVPPHMSPSHLAQGNITAVDDVGWECLAGLLCDLDAGQTELDPSTFNFLGMCWGFG